MTTPADRPQDRVADPSAPPVAGSADQAGQPGRDMPVIRVPSQQDLPVPMSPPPLPAPAIPRGPAPKPAVGFLGDVKRSGHWRVEPVSKFVHILGDAVIDLREAEFASPTVEIQVMGALGDTKIVVTPGTDVVIQGTIILGDQKMDPPVGATPTGRRVIVTVNSILGDLKVYMLEPGEKIPRWWHKK